MAPPAGADAQRDIASAADNDLRRIPWRPLPGVVGHMVAVSGRPSRSAER